MDIIYLFHTNWHAQKVHEFLSPYKSLGPLGRNSIFLAGKPSTVAATSPACRRFRHCVLFLKIQARPRPWWPCLLWRPWTAWALVLKLVWSPLSKNGFFALQQNHRSENYRQCWRALETFSIELSGLCRTVTAFWNINLLFTAYVS